MSFSHHIAMERGMMLMELIIVYIIALTVLVIVSSKSIKK